MDYISGILTDEVALISLHFLKVYNERAWNLLSRSTAAHLSGKDFLIKSAVQLGNTWNTFEIEKIYASAFEKVNNEINSRVHYIF